MRATEARYDRATGRVTIDLINGCAYAFPAQLVQYLNGATDDQLASIEVDGLGFNLHWPELDTDLYVPALVSGMSGTRVWMMRELARRAGQATSPTKAAASRANGAKGGRPRGGTRLTLPLLDVRPVTVLFQLALSLPLALLLRLTAKIMLLGYWRGGTVGGSHCVAFARVRQTGVFDASKAVTALSVYLSPFYVPTSGWNSVQISVSTAAASLTIRSRDGFARPLSIIDKYPMVMSVRLKMSVWVSPSALRRAFSRAPNCCATGWIISSK